MMDLHIPIAADGVRGLAIGHSVRVHGVMVTARDAAHKFMVERLIAGELAPEDQQIYRELRRLLEGGVVYHCGPVVRKRDDRWEFVAAGPTTSTREEIYEPQVIEHFGLRAVVGKGGMGPKTLEACQKHGAVYLHAIGGAASLIAQSVAEVIDVHKLAEFGVPEAMWVIRVDAFPAVVTMDAHGHSLHADVESRSRARLESLLAEPS